MEITLLLYEAEDSFKVFPPFLLPMVGSQLADGQAHFVICETCLKATVIPAALLPKRLSPSLTWKAQKHGLY